MGWYATKSAGNHQGIVADEQTGKTIAVVYEVTDISTLAAAPDLLAALEGVIHHSNGVKSKYQLPDSLIRHIESAIQKAKGAL